MASKSSKTTTTHINKSAVTGKIVTNAYVVTHPATTYVQTIHKKAHKKQ